MTCKSTLLQQLSMMNHIRNVWYSICCQMTCTLMHNKKTNKQKRSVRTGLQVFESHSYVEIPLHSCPETAVACVHFATTVKSHSLPFPRSISHSQTKQSPFSLARGVGHLLSPVFSLVHSLPHPLLFFTFPFSHWL